MGRAGRRLGGRHPPRSGQGGLLGEAGTALLQAQLGKMFGTCGWLGTWWCLAPVQLWQQVPCGMVITITFPTDTRGGSSVIWALTWKHCTPAPVFMVPMSSQWDTLTKSAVAAAPTARGFTLSIADQPCTCSHALGQLGSHTSRHLLRRGLTAVVHPRQQAPAVHSAHNCYEDTNVSGSHLFGEHLSMHRGTHRMTAALCHKQPMAHMLLAGCCHNGRSVYSNAAGWLAISCMGIMT